MRDRLFNITKLVAGVLKEVAEMHKELDKAIDLKPGNIFRMEEYECIVLECVEDGAKVLMRKLKSEGEK